MRAAVAAMLEGMPEPRDLRLHRPGGRCVIAVGGTVLFDYDAADTLMRNVAISAAGVHWPAGRRGTGAERQLRGDLAQRGAAGGIGGADPPRAAGPALQAGRAGLGQRHRLARAGTV